METAIVIGMNYDQASHAAGQLRCQEIHRRMLAAGFAFNGRLYHIERPPHAAYGLARAILDRETAYLPHDGRQLGPYIQDFYRLEVGASRASFAPSECDIEVHALLFAGAR